MAVKRPKARETLARNLKGLMRDRGWNQTELAAKSGVSQRMISAVLSEQSGCSVETADALARPFGLDGWELMIPGESPEMLKSPTFGKLLFAYMEASDEARKWVHSFLERDRNASGPPPNK